MKKILVATDFSEAATKALDFALQSAKYLPVEISVLHAYELSGDVYTDYMGLNREYNQAVMNDLHVKMEKLKNEILNKEGTEVKMILSERSLSDALQIEVEENGIDLIVMGTHGASGIKEKIWGSITAAMIRKTKVPLMAIPLNYTWKKPQKILFSTNQFEENTSILDYIFEMADLYLSQVHVAVFSEKDEIHESQVATFNEKIPAYEKMLREKYNENSLTAIQLTGSSYEEIMQEHISMSGIDILAMVTYKKGFIDRLLHPSVTGKMSYHTLVPLLAIPAGN